MHVCKVDLGQGEEEWGRQLNKGEAERERKKREGGREGEKREEKKTNPIHLLFPPLITHSEHLMRVN